MVAPSPSGSTTLAELSPAAERVPAAAEVPVADVPPARLPAAAKVPAETVGALTAGRDGAKTGGV
jgi:hypothetical protein